MDERLREAARCGNIDSLYKLVQENPNLLDHIDQKPFATTPLHVAAFAGQTQFAKEIMMLKPSFANKLNEDGFSPMHLAFQKKQTRSVLQLFHVDQDLVCIKGREGMTPLHCAAKAGEINLLLSFLNACPKSIEGVTIRNETALHVALNSGMFQALEVLVGWLKEGSCKEDHYRERKVMNWKDEEGNTVLHIAASKIIPQALRMLLDCRVDVKSKNRQGLTALDIINGQAQSANAEIIDMIGRFGALAASLFPPVDCFGDYLRLDQWLRSAAKNGHVDALYAIIQEDPYILERIDQVPFDDTPLHIAASAGHTQFALEVMRLKPSLASKLNRDGSSPMHLALLNNQLQTVRRLLDADDNLVRVKGRKGLTPLHYTAEKGMLELLVELLMACPRSIEDLTAHKESALHIAAKNDRLEALELLVNWLEHVGQNEVLEWPDDQGNTVLHIASRKNQIQVVDLLTETVPLPACLIALFPSCFGPRVDLNAKNLDGSTAVDILQNQEQLHRGKIRRLQRLANCTKSLCIPGVSGHADYLSRRISRVEKLAVTNYRQRLLMSNETRNAILVVAILIATSTYQAVLSPPGGLPSSIPNSFNSSGTFSGGGTGSHANATATAPMTTNPNSINLRGQLVYSENSEPTSSFRNKFLRNSFLASNNVAFVMSIVEMVTVLPNGLLGILPQAIPLLLCYGLSVIYTWPIYVSSINASFLALVASLHTKWATEEWVPSRRRWTLKQILLKQRQSYKTNFNTALSMAMQQHAISSVTEFA